MGILTSNLSSIIHVQTPSDDPAAVSKIKMSKANPLQLWQFCFKPRPLPQSPTRTQSSAGHTSDSPRHKRSSSRESDWLSLFLDHPFLVQHMTFTEFRRPDWSDRQTFALATLLPDIIINLKDFWQKEPEMLIGVLLCADVAGFTNLCDQYSSPGSRPGGIYRITTALNRVLGEMVDLIYKCEGDVFKFSGDALLALWRVGRDQYLFEVVHQVVSCALLIQNKLTMFRSESNLSLQVKVAVSAGMLHLGILGTERMRHYLLAGPAVTDVKLAGPHAISGDVVVAASAWDHCCSRNYDYYPTKNGNYVKVTRILYNPSGKSVHMTKVLHSLNHTWSKNYDSKQDITIPSFMQTQTPSYSSESLSIRRSSSLYDPNDEISSDSSHETTSVSYIGDDYTDTRHVSVSSKCGIYRDDAQSTIDNCYRRHPSDVLFIRPAVIAAAKRTNGTSLREFMNPPVVQQVDSDQPLEYLTEMRHVTSMFVNIVPEEISAGIAFISLVDHAYTTVCRLVYSAMGVVNKISLFDKDVMLLCVFGLRGFKHQQESESALRCASSVRRTLKALHGVRFVSVGITTGMVYCGVVGHPLRQEYTVVGAPVNHAARLMMAYPGRVTCDRITKRQSCLPSTVFRELPLRYMKGVRGVERVFEYREDVSNLGPCISVGIGPLLGRDHVIDEIQEIFRSLHRKFQAVMLIGEPRIGKSRLLTVLAEVLIRDPKPLLLQLQPSHSVTPFAAAHFIARQVLGLRIVERQARLQQLLPDVTTNDLSCLNKKLAVNFVRSACVENPERRVRLSGRRDTAVKLIVKLLQQLDPMTLFLLDDVHLADEHSCHFAHDIMRAWRPDQHANRGPMIVSSVGVAGMRPAPTINRLLSNLANVRFITLDPLPPEMLAPLACQLLSARSVEFELVRVLEEHSRGNPGWCESYLTALVTSNGLRVENITIPEMRAKGYAIPEAKHLSMCRCSKYRSLSEHSQRTPRSEAGSRNDHGTRRICSKEDRGLGACPSWESVDAPLTLTPQDENLSSISDDEVDEIIGSGTIQTESQKDAFLYLHSMILTWRTYWKIHLREFAESKRQKLHEQDSQQSINAISCSSLQDESKVQCACILAPHLDYNEEAAAHLNGAIVASFDALPPVEQILLKCGSVLGQFFHRSVLFELVKDVRPVPRKRIVQAVQRLFEMGVFECNTWAGSATTITSEPVCGCDIDQKECDTWDVPRYALCRWPRFRASMVRTAVLDLLPGDQRRDLHEKAAKFLQRRRPVCSSCRARARLSASMSSNFPTRPSTRQSVTVPTGSTLGQDRPQEAQILFTADRPSNATREPRTSRASAESAAPNPIQVYVSSASDTSVGPKTTSQAADEAASTESARRSADSMAGFAQRKSSLINPVRFSMGLTGPRRTSSSLPMGPARTSSTLPTKPALRRAVPALAKSSADPESCATETNRSSDDAPELPVQFLVAGQEDQLADITVPVPVPSAEQNDGSGFPEQPISTVDTERFPSVMDILLPPKEAEWTLQSDKEADLQAAGSATGIVEEPFEPRAKQKGKCRRLRQFTSALCRIRTYLTTLLHRDNGITLSHLIACLPSGPCGKCECPMLLADIYKRLIDHYQAAGQKVRQLRFMAAYGALTMVAGYPFEAIFALDRALQVAEQCDDEETASTEHEYEYGRAIHSWSRRSLNNIKAYINVLNGSSRDAMWPGKLLRPALHKITKPTGPVTLGIAASSTIAHPIAGRLSSQPIRKQRGSDTVSFSPSCPTPTKNAGKHHVIPCRFRAVASQHDCQRSTPEFKAEARLQIGNVSEARRYIVKEIKRLPWKRSKALTHAHAINSDMHTIEGQWTQAEREGLRAFKAAERNRQGLVTGSHLLADAAWALAGAIDAARISGHPRQSELLEKLVSFLDPIDEYRSVVAPDTGYSGVSLSGTIPGTVVVSASGTPMVKRKWTKSCVMEPRRARAAARLLYSIFVARFYRGDLQNVKEPGDAVLSGVEQMGANSARALVLPHLALAKLMTWDIPRAVYLIAYLRAVLEREGDFNSLSARHSSAQYRDSTNIRSSRRSYGDDSASSSSKPFCLVHVDISAVLIATAEYHCVRLDSILFAGVSLRNAHREAEYFMRPLLGAGSIATPAARRVAARLALLNARRGRWTECALLATMATPRLLAMESDSYTGVAETGWAALCILEATLYGRATIVRDAKAEASMERLIKGMSQWLKALGPAVKQAPILSPRYFFLSAYSKLLRGHTEKALKVVSKAAAIADKQGNVLERERCVYHKAVWQGHVAPTSAAEWMLSVDRQSEASAPDGFRISSASTTFPLASIPSGEAIATTRGLSTLTSPTNPPPPPSPVVPVSPRARASADMAAEERSSSTDQTDITLDDFKLQRRSVRLSLPQRYSGEYSDEYLTRSWKSSAPEDSCQRRDFPRASEQVNYFDMDMRVRPPSESTSQRPNPAVFFCLPPSFKAMDRSGRELFVELSQDSLHACHGLSDGSSVRAADYTLLSDSYFQGKAKRQSEGSKDESDKDPKRNGT